MFDFTKNTDDQLFKGNEQPGSDAAYKRDIEIQRRRFFLEKAVADAQIKAAEAQIVAADATVRTAK